MHFNPRSPCGERRGARGYGGRAGRISIHAPRVGSDLIFYQSSRRLVYYFNPRSPCRERQRIQSLPAAQVTFQSTLPVWGATYAKKGFGYIEYDISIHAPCVWSDDFKTGLNTSADTFQSTFPAWGATRGRYDASVGGRISIHAPRVGSDCPPGPTRQPRQYFNPRSPCGERRLPGSCITRVEVISIHAPRVGSDLYLTVIIRMWRYFNPRSPRGERLRFHECVTSRARFQSTLPAWGATRRSVDCWEAHHISIHAPRVGSDRNMAVRLRDVVNFNPRSPRGERLGKFFQFIRDIAISNHAPRVGSDV